MILNTIKNDLAKLIINNPQVNFSDNFPGIYLIYLESDFDVLPVLPFFVEKSTKVGPHWSTQRSRLKSFLTSPVLDATDNVVFCRIHKYINDYKEKTGEVLTIDNVKAILLSKVDDVFSLDSLEVYWTSRLVSSLSSVSHSLFVKMLRRLENLILYSKDDLTSRQTVMTSLVKTYDYGTTFLNEVMLYDDLTKTNEFAVDNIRLFAYYIYEKGLPYIEDEEFVDVDKTRQARNLFYDTIKKYFENKKK